jgi:hypothetical protein
MARCTGRSSQTGEPCKAWAIKGSTVCTAHGGRAPQVKKAARERLERQEAERAAALYGLPREVDPHTALLGELWRTQGYVDWLEGELTADEAKRVQEGWRSTLMEERRHLANVARDCIRAGIEERRVTLAEQQGQLLAQAISGILADLGIAISPEVGNVVRRHLSLVDSG